MTGKKILKPLGLPQGSIRAALTISIALTTVYLVIFSKETLPVSLRNVFIVAVAFYYSSRANFQTINPKKDSEPSPLFLPTATVRISLAILTMITIGLVLLENQEIPAFMVTVIFTILGYSLGTSVKEISVLIFKPDPENTKFQELFLHIQAAVILLVVVSVCLTDIIHSFAPFTEETIQLANQGLELAVGYYFGSRTQRVV